MLEIKELPREQWENYELAFSYETDGYYSFQVSGWDFSLTFNPYPAPVRREFTGHLFEGWLESPAAFGAFYDGRLAGVAECAAESWNNRFRITNLLVFEGFRGLGIGKRLIQRAEEAAKARGARMLILETQTCNRKAVDFYLAIGFRPIGFDLFCYSNSDPDMEEVRVEMAKPL